MNDNTPALSEILYTPSFRWLIRICTPLYFSSVLVVYSTLSTLDRISECMILIVMLFFWAEFDILIPIHNWLVTRYDLSFKISPKDQLIYFNSYQFSFRRNEAYSRIIQSYPTGHYVYIIKDASASGYYKIGRTNQPQRRIGRFEIILPFTIHIVAIISCEDEILLEAALHKQFSGKRINGEWFNLNGDDINWIVTHYGLLI